MIPIGLHACYDSYIIPMMLCELCGRAVVLAVVLSCSISAGMTSKGAKGAKGFPGKASVRMQGSVAETNRNDLRLGPLGFSFRFSWVL